MLEIEIIENKAEENTRLYSLSGKYGDVAQFVDRKGYAIKTNSNWLLIGYALAGDFITAKDSLEEKARIIGHVKKIVIEQKK